MRGVRGVSEVVRGFCPTEFVILGVAGGQCLTEVVGVVGVRINPHHSLLGQGEGIKQYMIQPKNGIPTTTRDGDNIYYTSNIIIIIMLDNNVDNNIINYDYIITPTTVSIQE